MAAKPMNKFTKSVLEREQKDQTKPSELPIEEKGAASEKIDPISKKEKNGNQNKHITTKIMPEKPIKRDNPKPEQDSNNKPDNTFSLENFLIPEQGRQAKNKTFYLDAAVIEAIKKAAVLNHIAESKLVNDILKKVLNV